MDPEEQEMMNEEIKDEVRALRKIKRRHEKNVEDLEKVKNLIDLAFIRKTKEGLAHQIAIVEKEIKTLTKTLPTGAYYEEEDK